MYRSTYGLRVKLQIVYFNLKHTFPKRIYLVKIEDKMRLVRDLEALLPPAQALRLVLLQLLKELQYQN